MTHPLLLYADGLRRTVPTEHWLRLLDGRTVPLPLDRYVNPADAVDRVLLTGLDGPVLDVGCGPGRHLRALAARGVFALGVDLSPAAVRLATGSGARAIVASIFDELPGGGAWRTALLLDGNIGIGGSPERLLRRIGALLRSEGTALIELDPAADATVATLARIETTEAVSRWFPWAWVSVRDIEGLAGAAGFICERVWSSGGRAFAALRVQGDVAIASRPGKSIRTPTLCVEERELPGDASKPAREGVIEHPRLQGDPAPLRAHEP